MTTTRVLVVASVMTLSSIASADDILDNTGPPGETAPTPTAEARIPHHLGKPEAPLPVWGGGVRMTGLSGIGALPGVNIGGEVAVYLRHDEVFGELALGRWKPSETYVVTETPEHVELGLDVWSARGGWASQTMPLRAWALAEVGELAGPKGVSGAVARMVQVTVPADRRWVAAGGGFGVAWPMADLARLVGTVEFAFPLEHNEMMVDRGQPWQPDAAVARCSLGLEVGWR